MNEAGAGFAGDATGLQGCVIASGVVAGQGYSIVGGVAVSRAFHEPPGLST
jgi:hypothetical protein